MAEWLKAAVLKTVKGLRPSRVRIPLSPPVRKCLCWLALCEGSPADFKRKLKFFIFQIFVNPLRHIPT